MPLELSGDPQTVVRRLGAWLQADNGKPEPLVIETSGSTGRPKRVLLSRDAVLASARATARRLGGEGRWLLTLPASYVAGVQVVVRSLLAGQAPVVAGDRSVAVALRAEPAAYVSVVPTQLRRMLDDPEQTAALRDCAAVLVGGGPVGIPLRDRAADAGVRAVATYGSSETAGGCVYDGLPLDGVGVAIAADGRIRIAGPTLFDGYEGDPALTADTLVDGWFLTSDAGRLDEDGHLQVIGRLDDVVVTGGVNVPGPAVAERLRAHPLVAQAEVLGVPDEQWGSRVVAFVEPRGAGRLTLDEARDWVARERPREWAPRQLVVLDALPLLDNGKADRSALRSLAEEG